MRWLLTKQLRIRLGSRVWQPRLGILLLGLLTVAFFCRLGFWQLARALEKEQMTARYEQRLHMPPLDLPQLLSKGADVEDFPVRLQGRYDNSRLVYLDNQPNGPVAGFHVYTVFFPEGDATGILVNRGWVPVGQDFQSVPAVPAATGVEVVGSVALPSPYFTVGEPDYQKHPLRVSRLEMSPVSAALGVQLRPFVIRLDAAAADGFRREWSPAARLGMPPDKHRAYAFQWFCLALTVLVVLVVVNLSKSGSRNDE
ncbi:MAG: SURF1 family protein [Moraxellaceae bacterium]